MADEKVSVVMVIAVGGEVSPEDLEDFTRENAREEIREEFSESDHFAGGDAVILRSDRRGEEALGLKTFALLRKLGIETERLR